MSLLGFLRRAPREDADVVVLGGGIPAMAIALELAGPRRRVSVLVRGATGGGGAPLGLVAVGPGLPYTSMASALGPDATRTLWSAGRENVERLRAWLGQAGDDCGFEERGTFLVAATREEAEALAASEDRLREDGFPGEFLDHYMLETHFDMSGFPAAYWAADGGELDAARLGPLLAAAAREAGARFHPAPVTGLDVGRSSVVVETLEGRVQAATAVVATDAAASALVPVVGNRLMSAAVGRLRVGLEDGASLPTAARTADGRLAWQVKRGQLLVAAGGRAADRVDAAALEDLAERLPTRPSGATRWTAREDVSRDGLPLIGRLPRQPLAVACGLGAAPASLAFAAAGWIARALQTGTDPTPAALRVDRAPRAGAPV